MSRSIRKRAKVMQTPSSTPAASPVKRYTLTPAEIEARYGPRNAHAGKHAQHERWASNRARNRAAGLDRFGKSLPRVAGTNPRALGTNPTAIRPGVEVQW